MITSGHRKKSPNNSNHSIQQQQQNNPRPGRSCHGKTSEPLRGEGPYYGFKRKRQGGGGDISFTTSSTSTTNAHSSGNKCFCCLCVMVADFVTNTCLPAIGITRCRSRRKYRMDEPHAQNIMKGLNQQFNRMYGIFHVRLLPAFRPIFTELCFPGSQMEADGLTIVAAQIWTATYLLKSEELTSLSRTDRDKLRESYVELAWECEKAFNIDEKFYTVQQKFKKRVLPKIWRLEEKYSGERRYFLDDYREDLTVVRPFDDLYLRDKFRLKKNLTLKFSIKNGLLPDGLVMTTGKGDPSQNVMMMNKDKEYDFVELNSGWRVKVILSLLKMSIKSVAYVGRGLEKTSKFLSEEYDAVKCAHTLEMMDGLLRITKNDILLSSGKESEVIDWICSIIDDTNNYISCTQWVADRVAEIRGMCQVCYEHIYYNHILDLSNFHLVSSGAIEAQRLKEDGMNKYENSPSTHLGWKEFLNSINSTGSTSPSNDLENPLSVQNNNDFLSSEYPYLLQKLPLHVDDLLLKFK